MVYPQGVMSVTLYQYCFSTASNIVRVEDREKGNFRMSMHMHGSSTYRLEMVTALDVFK